MNLRQQLQCELARREFWEYCKLLYPSFYKEERGYLKELCNALENFYYNDDEYMIINAPPRHGKSFTAGNFVEWVLGQDATFKIMTGSYNEDLSKTFSKKVRTTIETEKVGETFVYSDIFPNTKIKYGSAEAKKWQTDASSQINYLATSPTGTATGFGADMEVIDDLIKSDEEANNETVLEKHWDWFVNTMLSRREGKKKVLIIMTRWRTKDLAGRIIDMLEEEGAKYTHINFKAKNGDKMLCEDIFSLKDYSKAMKIMSEDTFKANYQQEPMDLKGALYQYFLEYDEIPKDIRAIENYTDTADEGADSLCSINYAVGQDGNAYILDVLFTKESMETTEKKCAEMITKDNVNFARIESNNGGRGFSRNVERIAKTEYNNSITIFKPFHQSANKVARILTGSTGVMRNVYFPKGWKLMWREFYEELQGYQREGKNKHDDAPDALTGVYEILEKKYKKKRSFSANKIF